MSLRRVLSRLCKFRFKTSWIIIIFMFNSFLLFEHLFIARYESREHVTSVRQSDNSLDEQSDEPNVRHTRDVSREQLDDPNDQLEAKFKRENFRPDREPDDLKVKQNSSDHLNISKVGNISPNGRSYLIKMKNKKQQQYELLPNVSDKIKKLYEYRQKLEEYKTRNMSNVKLIKMNRNQDMEARWARINQERREKYKNRTNTSTMASEVVERMEKEFYRKREEVVNKFMHTFSLKPNTTCVGDVFLLVLVHSKPDYHERRDAIRRTWGSLRERGATWGQKPFIYKIELNFVVGQSTERKYNTLVAMESTLYGDILQGDFVDSYKNMTLKSLLGLKYASEHCSHVPYLLKSDDDMFINIPYLIRVLTEESLERSIMGPYNDKSKVYRKGKWSLSKEEFPFEFYPPYESGSAYVITMDIVKQLYDTSMYVPWLFIDDVYITGILGKIINVTHVYKAGMFAYWTDKKPDHCDIILDTKITMTKCPPKVLDSLWSYLAHGDAYLDKCRHNFKLAKELEVQLAKQKEAKLVKLQAAQAQNKGIL